ncbi:MAG: sensor histidine kinase, partial [Lachnospiraceae bacterium]|nr:sensor histidine kinase [Lachnospiraceae bacterium]
DREKYRIEGEEIPDLEEHLLLPLLLQPVVENAIVHGLEQVAENGQIDIRVDVPEKGLLRIAVSDNGCGMGADELETLRIRMAQKTLDRTASIGLCNINQRIRLYYGEAYGMAIESIQGAGTCITLKIPVKFRNV